LQIAWRKWREKQVDAKKKPDVAFLLKKLCDCCIRSEACGYKCSDYRDIEDIAKKWEKKHS